MISLLSNSILVQDTIRFSLCLNDKYVLEYCSLPSMISDKKTWWVPVLWLKAEAGKLRPEGQIQPTTVSVKMVVLPQAYKFVYMLLMMFLHYNSKSRIIATEILWFSKSKIFTIWPITESLLTSDLKLPILVGSREGSFLVGQELYIFVGIADKTGRDEYLRVDSLTSN